MKFDWARIPLLVIVAGMFVLAAYDYEEGGQEGGALFAIGAVVIGAYLALECIAWYERLRLRREREEDGGDRHP